MRTLLSALACTTALLAAAPALAQKIAPGLWEHRMALKGGSGGEMDAAMARMKGEMARMSPEQRKMMEDMMARQGASVGGAGGKTVSFKHCVTPEMAARDEMPQQDGSCRQTSKERSGHTLRFKFACTGKDGPTSGEGETTFTSDKQHRGTTVVHSTVNGKPDRMEMTHSGQWLAADCGSLR